MPKTPLEEFVDMWWKVNGPALAGSELAADGQFDELPYVEWEKMHED